MTERIRNQNTDVKTGAAAWTECTSEQETAGLRQAIEESRWLEIDIRSKTEQMISLREAAGRMTAILSEGCGKRSGQHDMMERAVVSMVDLEKEISGEICQLMKVRERMMACLNRMKKPENRTVLQLRYLNGKSWQEIADILGCSLHTVYRRHRTAMQELEDAVPDDVQNAQTVQGKR